MKRKYHEQSKGKKDQTEKTLNHFKRMLVARVLWTSHKTR